MGIAKQINFDEYLEEKEEHLKILHRDSRGWITIANINESYKQWHYKYKDILKIAEGNNIYISQNTFYKPQRRLESIKELKTLYIDLDCYKTSYSKDGVLYFLQQDHFKRNIPEPNLIIDSGRGLYLIWRIKSVPSQALPLWKAVEEYFYKTLKEYGADSKSLDATRVLRIAGTLNTKSNTVVNIIEQNDYVYDLREIQEEYLPILTEKKAAATKKGRPKKAISLFNSYSLVWARIQDLIKICEFRAYDLEGHREMVLFLYRYWNCLYIGDTEDALRMALELNKDFNKPLADKEVINATKSAEKCYLSKDKQYNYSNAKLIEILEISEEEQVQLKTIISTREKNRRKKETNKANRRNENGLTPKQQELKELKEQVIKLKEQGLNNTQVSNELNIDRAKVRRLLK